MSDEEGPRQGPFASRSEGEIRPVPLETLGELPDQAIASSDAPRAGAANGQTRLDRDRSVAAPLISTLSARNSVLISPCERPKASLKSVDQVRARASSSCRDSDCSCAP